MTGGSATVRIYEQKGARSSGAAGGHTDDSLSLGLRRILQLPAIKELYLTGFWTLAPAVGFGGGQRTGTGAAIR